MSYKITLSDRSVLLASTKEGDNIKAMRMEQNPPKYFQLGDKNEYLLEKITKFEWIADEPVYKALPEPPRCHGQKSIHMIIYENYRKMTGKPKWEEYRKKAYDYIYEQKPNAKFCDWRKGTCFCERSAVERVQEIIPGAVEIRT